MSEIGFKIWILVSEVGSEMEFWCQKWDLNFEFWCQNPRWDLIWNFGVRSGIYKNVGVRSGIWNGLLVSEVGFIALFIKWILVSEVGYLKLILVSKWDHSHWNWLPVSKLGFKIRIYNYGVRSGDSIGIAVINNIKIGIEGLNVRYSIMNNKNIPGWARNEERMEV